MRRKSKIVAGLFHLVWKIIWNSTVILVCAGLIFVGVKANQPMSVAGAPQGLTYIEFMNDRINAAKTVEPSRCGWGMILSLIALGPIYSVVYITVAINPDGTLAKMVAPDPDIPKDVDGAKWYVVPGIWWGVVERLSWTMLGKATSVRYQFRRVK